MESVDEVVKCMKLGQSFDCGTRGNLEPVGSHQQCKGIDGSVLYLSDL